jgi:hypothetical protein
VSILVEAMTAHGESGHCWAREDMATGQRDSSTSRDEYKLKMPTYEVDGVSIVEVVFCTYSPYKIVCCVSRFSV